MTTGELYPAGVALPTLDVGDLVFVRRPRWRDLRGTWRHRAVEWLLGAVICTGQLLRPTLRQWADLTHVACSIGGTGLIEAHASGVHTAHVSEYRDRDCVVVRTRLAREDQNQALLFLRAALGESYAFLTFLGVAWRMLTPGRMGVILSRTGGICSGLAAQMLERGWYSFTVVAASLCPAELARDLGVRHA